jgi:hypothetical protein
VRTAITLRLDAELLHAAREEARRDNRTLTNLIELALKRHLARAAGGLATPREATGGTEGVRAIHAAAKDLP